MYGKGVVTDQTCQNFFVKFRAREFLLDNAPWSGWPVEVDSNQIETLSEHNQCYTMKEIADNTQNVQINKVICENEKKNYLVGSKFMS